MKYIYIFLAVVIPSLLSFPGILVVFKVEPTGLGGSLNVWFMCSGCEKRSLMFQGSAFVEGSKRTVVGLTLALSFLSGHGFANFNRTLRQYLGILCISKNRYYDVIKLAYPHLKDILDEMCEDEKKNMQELSQDELGSWTRAVVTSDGVCHTHGHFSKNGSFIVKNIYLVDYSGTGTSACRERMMLSRRSCMRAQQSRWRVC